MTYIVGYKQTGINTLITDQRISWKSGEGEREGTNNALKSGVLFPGCIYAISGNVEAASEFIEGFHRYGQGEYKSLSDLWKFFMYYINEFDFKQYENSWFVLVLSSRESGMPSFYILDSDKAQMEPSPRTMFRFSPLDQGSSILDDYLNNDIKIRLKLYNNILSNIPDNQWRIDFTRESYFQLVSPYLICLWLSEKSLTLEASILESHQVGGVFHFGQQDTKNEYAQLPSVYIYTSLDIENKKSYSWVTRVAFAAGTLYIESMAPQSEETAGLQNQGESKIILNRLTHPDVHSLKHENIKLNAKLEEIKRKVKVNEELLHLNYFYFCGFGFVLPEHRKNAGDYHIFKTNGLKDDLFQEENEFSQNVRNTLNHLIKEIVG